MSRDFAANEQFLDTATQLESVFSGGCKGDAPLGVGTEHEKFGFDATTLLPLAYEGDNGIGEVLQRLVDRHGYTPSYDGANILALEKDGGAVTLEPGGQFELSGRITRSIFETRDELRTHFRDLHDVTSDMGHLWSLLSLHPFVDLDQVPWMPKSRYGVMRNYLPKVASRPEWMMKMTCTVQANFDYRTEADAMAMLRVAYAISPLITALFAASPFRLGAPTGMRSTRMWVWEDTDPARTGVPSFVFDEQVGFGDWVQWLLDVPMFFIRREGQYVDFAGQSFRRFLAEGIAGHRPTVGDWELHLSTAFPDVRIKSYIETRTADAGPPWMLLALPALWKGILYDNTARDEALALSRTTTAAEARTFAALAARDGLDGTWAGHSVRRLATQLVEIAGRGLDRQAGVGPSERSFLAPLLDEDGDAIAPEETLRSVWQATDGDPNAILGLWELEGALRWFDEQ